LHPPGAHLERAGLVPVAARLSDRPFPGQGRPPLHHAGRQPGRSGAGAGWRRRRAGAQRERPMSGAAGVKYFKASNRPRPVMPSGCQSGGCGGQAADDPRLQPTPPSFGAVRVNGIEIEPDAIAQEIQHHPAPDGESAWQAAARALVLRELLLQEARRLGLRPQPGLDEAGRLETEDDAMIRALLEREVRPAPVGEAECRRYYEGHVDRFGAPDLFEASHILLEPDGTDDEAWAAAEAKALAIIAEVGDDPALFAAAAREFSCCP